MTNREKFKEVFGYYPQADTYMCKYVMCLSDCNNCLVSEKWDDEYKKQLKIKVGDRVKVIDTGEQYDTYNQLFNKSELPKEVISHFVTGDDCVITEYTYTVLEILEHDDFEDVFIAVIQDEFEQIYLIGVDGLEVC